MITVLSLLALWGTVDSALQNNGFSWSGEPSDEVIVAMALNTLSWVVVMPALSTAATASALGLVIVWCLSPDRQRSPRSTRMMSAAGSTEKRAAATMPNSSPSISNS